MAGTGQKQGLRVPYRGGALTILVLLVLFTPPSELLEQKGDYADVRADIRSPAATPVTVSADLRQDPSGAIPLELGEWSGADDDSWPDAIQDALQYESLLVRHYTRPGFYTPVQLMVLTAEYAGSFHNPTVCFRGQGNQVKLLDETTITLGADTHRVGRLVVHQEGQSDRVVYSIYLVQDKLLGKDLTTWIRLTFYGANETTGDQIDPYMVELLEDIAPYAFHARNASRTSIGALWELQPGLAIASMGLAVMPVTAEALLQTRRR